MLPLGGLHGKHGIWVPTQHLLWGRQKLGAQQEQLRSTRLVSWFIPHRKQSEPREILAVQRIALKYSHTRARALSLSLGKLQFPGLQIVTSTVTTVLKG
jgi:hypothetical protein